MAPTIPASANAAMVLAAKRTLSEVGPRTLRAAGYAIVVRRGVHLLESDAQKITFGVFFAYVVVISITYRVKFLAAPLRPFRILAVSFHEFSHAFVCLLTCGKVQGMQVDPNEGGCTSMHGGVAWLTLPAGYLGCAFIGALLVFCGFDIVASKIASFGIGFVSLLSLWWGMKTWSKKGYKNRWLLPLIIAFNVGLLVACWFIADSEALRFYVLFIGTMVSTYSIYDIYDDCIRRTVEDSDAYKFAQLCRRSVCFCFSSSRVVGIVWDILAVLFLAAAIIGGMLAFPQTEAQQRKDSDNFVDASPGS